jgi:FAD/FMN-containing dehydrogenase
MADLPLTTTTGSQTVIEGTTVETFKTSLRGELLRSGDTAYDEARKVWNGMIDKRPGLIARCTGVADVINAVDFACTHQLLVSVRGGGHNIPGNAVCNGGLMIDLACMRSVRVDPVRRTARAEGGVTWGEFDRETQVFGLATTGGSVSDTGIAGLTLGGGLGWLAGKCGLSCDNLLSADVVTADGKLLVASASEHADLFWGLRGGGGNFGIVTSFEYQLHPVGPVLAGMVLHPFAKAKEALAYYRDFAKAVPDEVNTMGGLLTSPDGDLMAVIAVCYNGSLDAGERVLRPLREFGPPVADQIRPMAYREVQSQLDAATVRGRRYYIKSSFMRSISDEAIDALLDRFANVPSPHTLVFFQQLGNAANRVGVQETAFSQREALCEWGCLSSWVDPAADEMNIGWTRTLAEAMQPFSSGGAYITQMGVEAEEGADRIKDAFGQNYAQLAALKNKYDPTNLFRHNQNIRPAR